MQNDLKRIILSRTDNLGDVVLTLPMAGVIKKYLPDAEIIFIGKKYTEPVIRLSEHIDQFIDREEIVAGSTKQTAARLRHLNADAIIHVYPDKTLSQAALKARIKTRVGTSHRLHHILNCNRPLNISRRSSDLHEAQLNLTLLKGLDFSPEQYRLSLDEIPAYYGTVQPPAFEHKAAEFLNDSRVKVILHPRSKGSAREWGLENYSRLIEQLDPEKYIIFITGTAEEGESMRDFLNKHKDRAHDLTGAFTLNELISFIARCDALVAASTGTLHIAAMLGIRAIGLFAPMRPIFPQRWAPLGRKASVLVLDKDCRDCRRTEDCHCIRELSPASVTEKLRNCLKPALKTVKLSL